MCNIECVCATEGGCVPVYNSYNFLSSLTTVYVLAVSIQNCIHRHRNHCIRSPSVLQIVICLTRRKMIC